MYQTLLIQLWRWPEKLSNNVEILVDNDDNVEKIDNVDNVKMVDNVDNVKTVDNVDLLSSLTMLKHSGTLISLVSIAAPTCVVQESGCIHLWCWVVFIVIFVSTMFLCDDNDGAGGDIVQHDGMIMVAAVQCWWCGHWLPREAINTKNLQSYGPISRARWFLPLGFYFVLSELRYLATSGTEQVVFTPPNDTHIDCEKSLYHLKTSQECETALTSQYQE